MRIILPIAVAPRFLLYIHSMVKIRGQYMLPMRAFLWKAFGRPLRFSRIIPPSFVEVLLFFSLIYIAYRYRFLDPLRIRIDLYEIFLNQPLHLVRQRIAI